MYVPDAFREDRSGTIVEFLRRHSFGLLVSQDGTRNLATHLPILFDIADGVLIGLTTHLARKNPQADRLAERPEVLAVFGGPHAYVSPAWYESEGMVPTWNYTAVQIAGVAETIRDPGTILDILHRTVETYESSIGGAWSLRTVPPDTVSRLAQDVVGLQISITGIEAAFKISQNKTPADRHGVIAGLRRSGGEHRELIGLMEAALPQG